MALPKSQYQFPRAILHAPSGNFYQAQNVKEKFPLINLKATLAPSKNEPLAVRRRSNLTIWCMKYEPKGKAAALDFAAGEKRRRPTSTLCLNILHCHQESPGETEVGTNAIYIGISSAQLPAICTGLAESVLLPLANIDPQLGLGDGDVRSLSIVHRYSQNLQNFCNWIS